MLPPLKSGRTTKQFSKNRNSFGIGFGRFNPDLGGNALAWYDGNIGLTTGQWNDQGSGSHNIIFTNLPTIVIDATPLRDAVRFNGTDESGANLTITLNVPFTIYLVVNSVSWLSNRYLVTPGSGGSILRQLTATPNVEYLGNLGSLNSNPDLAVGTWGVYTLLANGANSELRTNLNASVTGSVMSTNQTGIHLAASQVPSQFGNVEFGYIIVRTGADSTAIQDYMINGLRSLCGLTF